MSYNNTREDDERADEEKTVDQSKNTEILDGEARKDGNKSPEGDPEFMWFKQWKIREATMEQDSMKEEGEK